MSDEQQDALIVVGEWQPMRRRKPKPVTVAYTVGYSTRPPDVFAELVQRHGVKLVVDTRTYPGSRRQPWTTSAGMTEVLARYGIGYAHVPRLGGRRKKQPGVDYALVDGWRHAGFRNYGAFMQTDEFRAGLDELLALTPTPFAYLCCEALWWQCHRRMISDALELLHGVEVRHIMDDGLHEHRPIECAQVHDGRVVYPANGTVPLW